MAQTINAGKIQYSVGFQIDKTGLNELKNQLQQLSTMSATEIQKINPSISINEAMSQMTKLRMAVSEVQNAMNSSFNNNTGILNLEKLKKSLNSLNLQEIKQRFSAAGEAGRDAFLKISKSALTTSVQLKQTHTILDKMGQTLINTLKWQISSSAINRFTGAIQQAYGYVQHLDSSLNDIRIVTGKSADEMERFARTANKAAKSLGASTTDYTEAALIYYQQGLSDEEANARAATTLKAANVTGQSGAAVSEELTAVWNGYKVSAEETELAVDKLAAVAATTAADLEELSVGMSKVASAANNMGVDMDQLNAMIATIVSITRQAPESVGTALKTIFARMSDLKLGDTDEDGLKLGDVSGSLEKVGISILDTNGDLREMGDVIEEVAGKWDTWTKAQQAAIAQSLAGKRQYNNLVALFDNWDMYSNAINTSRNSMGTLQHQQDIYMESTEAHLQVLQTQWEDLYDSLLDTDTINTLVDALTKIVKLITNLVDSMGGFKGMLSGIIGLTGMVFSKQIAQAFTPFIQNRQIKKNNDAILADLKQNIELQKQQGIISGQAAAAMTKKQDEMSKYWHLMDAEEINASQDAIREIGDWETKREKIDEAKNAVRDFFAQSSDKKIAGFAKDDNLFANMSSGNNNALKYLDIQSQRVKKVKQEYNDLGKIFTKINANFNQKGIGQGNKQFDKSITDAQTKLKEMEHQIDVLSKKGLMSPEKAQEAQTIISDIQKRLDIISQPNNKKKGITDNLIQDFEKLNNIIPLTETQIDQYKQALTQAGYSEEEIDLKVKQLNRSLDQQRLQSELTAQSLTKIAGGISSLIYGTNSLSNIFDTLSNSDLSFGEKLQQTLLSVTTSLPMIKGGISNLRSGFEGLGSSGSAALAKIGEKGTEVLSFLTSGWGIAIGAALGAGVAAYKIASNIYQKEQERIARADAEAAKAAEEHTKVVDEQVSKIDELVKKYDELNEKIKNQETTTESARNEIYNLCKQYGLQDLALKTLIADYDELGDVIDEAQAKRKEEQLQASKEEKDSKKRSLRSSIWKGLSASQRDNNEIINGRTVSQTIDLSDMGDFERNVTTARSEFYSGLTNLGIEVGDWGHIDINALADVYAKNREGLLDLINNSNVDAAAELRDIIDKNIEQFDKYREIYQSERNLEAENKFATTFKDNIDSINSITSFNQTVQTLVNSLTTQDENGVRLFDSETEAEDFVRNYLNGIDKIKEYAKDADLAGALYQSGLSDKFGEKELEQQIGKRTQAAINFLAENSLAASSYETLDDFFKEYEERIKYENTKNNRINVEVAFNTLAEGKELDEETLNSLFDDTDLASVLGSSGISKEDFAEYSLKEQKQILLDYYITAISEEKQYQEIKKEGLNEDEKQRKTDLKEELDAIDQLKQKYADQNIGFTLMSADGAPEGFKDKIQQEFEYLKDATIVEVPVDIDFDTEEGIQKYKEFLNQVKEENPGIGFDIDAMLGDANKLESINSAQEEYQALLKKYSDGQKSLEELEAELANLTLKEGETSSVFEKRNYLPALKAVKQEIKELNSEVDSLQSTYQTLQNVVEDYNEDGALTLDNLQALMEMDSMYVATLELENGQLVINEDTYRSIIDAKLQEMRVSAAEQFLMELGVIATDAATKANLKMKDAVEQNAESINILIGKCKEGVNAVYQFAKSMAGVTADDQAVMTSAQAFFNRIQFIDEQAAMSTSSILGRSSGSSSSSGSEKEAKHEEYLKREHDIYRKINTELDQIGNKLDRIDEIESHSWGVSYLDALQEENKLLDEQLEKLEEKKALQIGDLGQRKKQLENEGFTFNENGSLITNAEDRLDALYASYNTNYVDKYNSMSADAQEEFEAEMKAEEDRIKQIEDAVGDYEKLYGDYEDLIKELQDLYYKQIEKDVEEFNFEIDLELELSDARKEWKDFWHDVVKDVESDDFVGQIAKSFSKLGELIGVGGSSNNDVLGLTQHLKETLDEVNTQITTHGLDGLFGTDTKLSEENLTNYRDKLMSALKDAKEEIENISDNYLSMLESAQDMIDKQVEGWENIGDQINHNLELIKLISGENTYDALAKQYEQQYDNNLQTIEAQRIGRDYWKEKIAEYKTLLAAAEEGTEEYKTLQKALDTSTEKYIEANKELNSTVEESIKNLQEWRKNSVSAITEVLDKAMSGGLGTDMLEQEWKLINDYADQYFDNVERAVNMEEYTNVLQDAANATGLTAKNQEKINKFMDEELKKLNEKEKLTQYDIDESKARLEILKAEMALQDAQRNKSNMRLRRDNQGNYTYQYTGNEQAIEDAEKAGLTARKAWYELVKKRNKETNDYIIQLEKDRISIMNQLDEAELAGDEERANKLKELLNRNEEQIVFAYGEAQKTKQDLFSGTAQYFADVENAEILPMWDATVTQLVDRFAGDNKDSFITACKNAINELDIVQERYVEKTQRILNIAGVKYQELVEEGIDPTKEAIEELNGTNEELAEGLDDTNEKLDEMRGYLEECAQAYRDFKDDAVSAIQEANQALETLARTHMDTINQINSTPINSAIYAPAIQGNLGYNENSSGGAGGGNNTTADNTLKNLLDNQARKENRGTIGSEIQVEAGSGRVVASSNNVDKKSVQNAVNNAIASNPNITYLKNRGSVAVNSAGEWFIKDQYAADIIKEWLKSKGFKFLNDGQIGFYVGSNNVNFGTPQQQTKKTALQTVTESYNASKENKTTINKNGLTSFPLEDTTSSSDSDIGQDFLERIKKKKGYKSGGYTGDWTGAGVDGIGGRMAVLHQKELVLNESDTSNMLAAVEALRQMNIDKLAQSILATSIATAQMQIQTQLLSAQLNGLRDQYESSRNTTINADFSGVRTADEILRAFEELENYGLQQYNTGDASYRSY